ncbi:MAG: hypothetical protein NTY60_09400 [Proteobacteria bacterium]|nr:hypothetical protein [Pseudomonadota bacterium]
MNKIFINAAGLLIALFALFLASFYQSEYGGSAALPVIALQFISVVFVVNLAVKILTSLLKSFFQKGVFEHPFE